jgi:hypothetical protein
MYGVTIYNLQMATNKTKQAGEFCIYTDGNRDLRDLCTLVWYYPMLAVNSHSPIAMA